MKKVLFATTALVATAGMAAAEVSFGGFGRFGLYYQENDNDVGDSTRVEQRFRLTATGVTTSDNGLKFEGRIRFQTDESGANPRQPGGVGTAYEGGGFGSSNVAQRSAAGFAVTSGGFRLDVGHVSDVLDSGDVLDFYGYGVGLTSFVEQSSGWSLPNSGFGVSGDDARVDPTIKLRYAMGDFTASVSYTDGAKNVVGDTSPNTFITEAEEWQVGFGYNFGNYNAGVAFGNRSVDVTGEDGLAVPTNADFFDNDFWALGFGGDIGAFAFSIVVGDSDIQDDTSYGFSVKYDISATTDIRFAFSDNGIDAADEAYGIGFRHSLGGGVSLRGGVGSNIAGNSVADLGVVFNF
ncbi:MAG: porin [Tateyamaria sp.]|jgi:outer membrane protein OmpU|uniref:porin n=1 Tax=Tateyamaria sp. TaxID=1929288 RepID=UPI0032DDB17A